MKDHDINILRFLAETNGEPEWYYPFKPICEATDLTRDFARRRLRYLARKGLTKFRNGLWSEFTDMPAGAGYGITAEGLKVLETQEPHRLKAK